MQLNYLSQIITQGNPKLGWSLRVVPNLGKWLGALYSYPQVIRHWQYLGRGCNHEWIGFFFFFVKELTWMLSAANVFTNWENEGFSCEDVCVCVCVCVWVCVCVCDWGGGGENLGAHHSIHYTHYPTYVPNIWWDNLA